ncbi:unnamed protein product [Candidula unifasciata]|uniref:SAM domain-containing protein n=1 Tax=Candidula unifasciata TaxID=100452 RepID=A0A8S3ZFX4_9EUPU|nr:unnamed protein product [Candidula unifasciata]
MASETNSSSIVEGWLRSVDMVQYTQAFLDNGYDDLEVCKQIGEADLNAIGVPNDHQREKLLQAVRVLREEGGAAVYFTLEDCDNCPAGDRAEMGDGSDETSGLVAGSAVAGKCLEAARSESSSLCLDLHDLGKQSLVTYPKAQLGYILRDKLVLENIDLSEPPYTTPVSPHCICVQHGSRFVLDRMFSTDF